MSSKSTIATLDQKLATVFKPVSGGYVYLAPRPWLFGRPDYRLVTEAQKQEIVDASAPPTFMCMFSLMMALNVVGVTASLAFVWYLHSYRFDDMTLIDMAIIMVTTLLAMLLAIRIALAPRMARLKPVLARLPCTDLRIPIDELRHAVKASFSARQTAWHAASTAFAAFGQLLLAALETRPGHGVMAGNGVSIMFLVFGCTFAIVAAFQIRAAILKAREETAAAVAAS